MKEKRGRSKKRSSKRQRKEGALKDWIDHIEMNKDTMHLHDTVPVTAEPINALEAATAETAETDKNEDQENVPESTILQMKVGNDSKTQN